MKISIPELPEGEITGGELLVCILLELKKINKWLKEQSK